MKHQTPKSLGPVSLSDALEHVARELGGVTDDLTATESTLFGWLADAQLRDAIPNELHKLDLTVQIIAELQDYINRLRVEINSEIQIGIDEPIDRVKLGDLKSRLDPRNSPGKAPASLGEESVGKVELF